MINLSKNEDFKEAKNAIEEDDGDLEDSLERCS